MSHPLPTTYAVVGAGPAGLVAARAFLRRGVDVEIIERHGAPGGIWNIEQVGSPMYETCNFISSRDFGGFIGFPMPEAYPMYPRWDQIRAYVQDFADAYGLTPRIRFDTECVNAEPIDGPLGRYWHLDFADGSGADYRGVVVANGSQWQPYLPRIPGLDSFTGRAIHSARYRSPEEFRSQIVLVVGAGNSGVDIAADAAFHADDAYLSTRRGYWFMPKFLFGLAVPDLLAGNIPDDKLGPLEGNDFDENVRRVFEAVGDLRAFGLPTPDHRFGTSHPIVNGQVLHCLAHGMLRHRPDIVRIDGSLVTFADGSTLEPDVIVFATGYDARIPWLPDGVITYEEGHPVTALGTFVSGQRGLYVAGGLHFAGNTFSVFDRFAQLAAADAAAELTGENADNVARAREEFRPDLRGEVGFLHTHRNANQVHLPAVERAFEQLRSEYGIEIPRFEDHDFYSGAMRPAEPVGAQ